MTREDRMKCPACGKPMARLDVHFRQSHPGLSPDDYGIGSGLLPADPDPALSAEAAVDPLDRGSVEGETDPDPEPRVVTYNTAPPQSAPESLPIPDIIPPVEPVAPAADFQAALAPLADMMRQLAAGYTQLQAQVLQQQKDMAEFQQSVIAGLNSVPAIADKVLTSRMDQMAAEYQQAQGMTSPEASPAATNPAAAMAGDPKMALLTSIIGPLLQRFMAPTPQDNGMGGINSLVATIKGVSEAANAIAAMQRGPWMEGARFASDIYYNASRSGLGVDKSADAVRDQIDRMGASPTS